MSSTCTAHLPLRNMKEPLTVLLIREDIVTACGKPALHAEVQGTLLVRCLCAVYEDGGSHGFQGVDAG